MAELSALADIALRGSRDTAAALSGAGILRLIDEARKRMSSAGAAFRDALDIRKALEKTKDFLDHFAEQAAPCSGGDLASVFRLRDILFCQYMYLFAMDNYIEENGRSRGSALYHHKGGIKAHPDLPEQFRFIPDDGQDNRVQETIYRNGSIHCSYREARPIPDDDGFFEKVWSAYREHGNVC
jgi:hypothetical protein